MPDTLNSAQSDTQSDNQVWLREISVTKGGPAPLYRQLYTGIRGLIVAGRWLPEGTRLPSSRFLAGSLGVSRNTVVLAYQRLAEDGYVRGMAGGGTVVTAAATKARAVEVDRPRRARTPRDKPVSRGVGLPNTAFPVGVPPVDLFPTALWASLTHRRLRVAGERVLLGADAVGRWPVREAVAAYLGVVRGIRCTPDQVVLTRGLEAGLDVLVRALLAPGAGVWCEEPGPVGLRRVLTSAGRVAHPVPVDADGFDVPAACTTAPPAGMAVLSASRQLPLSVPLSDKRRTLLLDHAAAHRMWVVEYEPDAAFLLPDAPPPLVTTDPDRRVVHIGTFNTVLFPQVHAGYCVLPPDLVEPVGDLLGATGGEVPALTQEVLADFLDHHRFARFLARARQTAQRRHARLAESLSTLVRNSSEIDLELLGRPGEGGYLTALFPSLVDDCAMVRRAHRVGVQVTALRRYYQSEPNRSGLVFGTAGVREEAIVQAMRLMVPILARR
ncbi:PLP-dependent aminotransferase family protein [Actinokineospora inagensis]|uniref:aminotransferase-like domain-containing protein n=1 Tax=Actinokineospora inagensis TaxID=103730 RepID=UPI0003FA3B48|nr:PLP-dependent aminotransferase family protein [Actinokineospora inagensis]